MPSIVAALITVSVPLFVYSACLMRTPGLPNAACYGQRLSYLILQLAPKASLRHQLSVFLVRSVRPSLPSRISQILFALNCQEFNTVSTTSILSSYQYTMCGTFFVFFSTCYWLCNRFISCTMVCQNSYLEIILAFSLVQQWSSGQHNNLLYPRWRVRRGVIMTIRASVRCQVPILITPGEAKFRTPEVVLPQMYDSGR